MIKVVFLTIILFLLTAFSYGQNQKKLSSLIIDSFLKKNYHIGDTLSLKIKNMEPTQKTITIEAVSLIKEPYYYNSIYSAYFNNDTLFFKKLKTVKRLSTQNKITYVLPQYELSPFILTGLEERIFNFIIKGKSKIKGMPLEFRITSILANLQSEIHNSSPFYLFSTPE